MTGAGGLGVFGGTFDPIHVGHLAAAQDVLEALGLDRVLFVPALRSPHKPDDPLSPAPLRLRMVRAAVEEDPRFEASDVELRREGLSYTGDTLRELAKGGRALSLILGADQWAAFARWREPREIARLARIVVMAREGDAPGRVDPGFEDGPPPPFVEVPVTRIDVSSTRLRERARSGRSVRYLVPEAVRRIIEAEKLYV